MPIPLIAWGIGLGAVAIWGAAKGARGVSDIKDAKNLVESAQNGHRTAVAALEVKRADTFAKAEAYGNVIVDIRNSTIADVASFLVELQARPNMRDLQVPADVEASVVSLTEFKATVIDAPNDLFVAAKALGAGSAASAGAIGLVGMLGTASTGAAIGGLSGVAATNATLAWFGGGALAAGGGGMAAGAVVLGGIAVAPVLLVAGFVVAGKGEKQLTEAKAYEAAVALKTKDVSALKDGLGKVDLRINEMKGLLQAINERVQKSFKGLDAATFDRSNVDDMQRLTVTLQAVKAMNDIMCTPILDKDGKVTNASGNVVFKYKPLVGG